MITLMTEEYADIFYDEQYYLLQIIWKPEMTDEDYKNVFNFCLEYAETHRVDNFMSDIRNQKIISPETRKWFEEEALPNAVQRGLKRAVIVFTGNVFKKYYANNILTRSKNFALPIKFFTSIEDGITWLKSFDD
jgi:hypothetical protein